MLVGPCNPIGCPIHVVRHKLNVNLRAVLIPGEESRYDESLKPWVRSSQLPGQARFQLNPTQQVWQLRHRACTISCTISQLYAPHIGARFPSPCSSLRLCSRHLGRARRHGRPGHHGAGSTGHGQVLIHLGVLPPAHPAQSEGAGLHLDQQGMATSTLVHFGWFWAILAGLSDSRARVSTMRACSLTNVLSPGRFLCVLYCADFGLTFHQQGHRLAHFKARGTATSSCFGPFLAYFSAMHIAPLTRRGTCPASHVVPMLIGCPC